MLLDCGYEHDSRLAFLYCFIHHVSAAGIVGYSFVPGPFDLALHRGALLGTIDVGVRTRHLRNAL